jgi:hypothetical protein
MRRRPRLECTSTKCDSPCFSNGLGRPEELVLRLHTAGPGYGGYFAATDHRAIAQRDLAGLLTWQASTSQQGFVFVENSFNHGSRLERLSIHPLAGAKDLNDVALASPDDTVVQT